MSKLRQLLNEGAGQIGQDLARASALARGENASAATTQAKPGRPERSTGSKSNPGEPTRSTSPVDQSGGPARSTNPVDKINEDALSAAQRESLPDKDKQTSMLANPVDQPGQPPRRTNPANHPGEPTRSTIPANQPGQPDTLAGPVDQSGRRSAGYVGRTRSTVSRIRRTDPVSQPGGPTRSTNPVDLTQFTVINEQENLYKTKAQIRVRDFLAERGPILASINDIARQLGIARNTVRDALHKFEHAGVITKRVVRQGGKQGLAIDPVGIRSTNPADQPGRPTRSTGPVDRASSMIDLNINKSNQSKASEGIAPADEFAGWADATIALYWPNLLSHGLDQEALATAIRLRRDAGKKVVREIWSQALDKAEWELETFGHLTHQKKGEKVAKPVAFICNSLAKWGTFTGHPDYVSEEELLLQQAAQELKKKQRLQQELDDMQFANWWGSLSDDERQQVDEAQKVPGPVEKWRKVYFRKHIKE